MGEPCPPSSEFPAAAAFHTTFKPAGRRFRVRRPGARLRRPSATPPEVIGLSNRLRSSLSVIGFPNPWKP